MRVLISSTFIDLVEHRLAVADAIERLGLALSRMETFGAMTEQASEACYAEVERSDLFVGIYAHRYGFVPPEGEKSITEAEFDHAFALRRPTFCFVVDQNYPWPEDLVEGEPGQSRLAAFKARLASLVVRDTFTTPTVLATRVASSLGRYLLADPRRHGSTSASDQVRLALVDSATMCFVDVMRLASVAASPAARTANQARYPEFVDIADQHLAELRAQTTRLVADTDPGVLARLTEVDRGISWAIGRLRRGPQLDRPWAQFIAPLRQAAERVNALAEVASPDYYASRLSEVAPIVSGTVPMAFGSNLKDPDAFVRLRFEAQSLVVAEAKASGKFVIASIRDDMDQRLAIPYFAIDYALLRKVIDDL